MIASLASEKSKWAQLCTDWCYTLASKWEREFMQRGVWEMVLVVAEEIQSRLCWLWDRRKEGEVEDPAVQSNQAHHNLIIMALQNNVWQSAVIWREFNCVNKEILVKKMRNRQMKHKEKCRKRNSSEGCSSKKITKTGNKYAYSLKTHTVWFSFNQYF